MSEVFCSFCEAVVIDADGLCSQCGNLLPASPAIPWVISEGQAKKKADQLETWGSRFLGGGIVLALILVVIGMVRGGPILSTLFSALSAVGSGIFIWLVFSSGAVVLAQLNGLRTTLKPEEK